MSGPFALRSLASNRSSISVAGLSARSFTSSPSFNVRQPNEWSYPSKDGDNKPRRPFLNPDVSELIPNKVAIRAGLPPYRLPSTNIDVYALPPTLPKTHDILTHSITFTAYEHESLRPYAAMVRHCALALLIPVTGPTQHPRKVKRWAAVRSPFVHAKSKEVFERYTYTETMDIWDAHDKSVEVMIKVLLASGRGEHVSIKVEKYSRGKFDVEAGPSEPTSPLLQTTKASTTYIQELADKLVREIEQELASKKAAEASEVTVESSSSSDTPSTTATSIPEEKIEEIVKEKALNDAEGFGSGMSEEIERKKEEVKELVQEGEIKIEGKDNN
ncbi:Mitochondrial ribosomal protein S10 [Phaffia rhodozyma]|uniref:Mitochondrial ribosomal protein S10 n=1 Tax=Phaffia rhodozyma TaxID=264483 RepID=A0A0F7SWZ8_PHARH|nr:Mitochondrial ribosomal protein S10 [Phaffia rhodozyma]